MLTEDDEKLIDEALKESHPVKDLTYKPNDDILDGVTNISPVVAERGSMPINDFGTEFKSSNGLFTALTGKGDKLRFRLLGAPFVEGKHFEELPDKKWNITLCPRINDRAECETCNKYFEIIMKAKKTGDKKLIELAKNDAKKYAVSISFYFPVIDRNTARFTIFNSRKSVKDAIDSELTSGTKVLDVDWVVLRTEVPGSNYYKTTRVDSSDTPPLTEEELVEVEKYKKMDLSQIISGTKEEDSAIAAEANVEEEDEKAK